MKSVDELASEVIYSQICFNGLEAPMGGYTHTLGVQCFKLGHASRDAECEKHGFEMGAAQGHSSDLMNKLEDRDNELTSLKAKLEFMATNDVSIVKQTSGKYLLCGSPSRYFDTVIDAIDAKMKERG